MRGICTFGGRLFLSVLLCHGAVGVVVAGPVLSPVDTATGEQRDEGAPELGQSVQLYFYCLEGITINWDVAGVGLYDSESMVLPCRQNFPAGAVYRLRLTTIPDRPNFEAYATIEIPATTRGIEKLVAQNAIPVTFVADDFDALENGRPVTKVVYFPSPEFQELSIDGIETLASPRLDPGVDPIVEAKRRGTILAIVRLAPQDDFKAAARADSGAAETSCEWYRMRPHCRFGLFGRRVFR